MNRLKPKLYGHRVNRKKVIATKPEGGGWFNLNAKIYPRYELMRAITPFF